MRWLVGMAELIGAADLGITYEHEIYADDAAWPIFFAHMPADPAELITLTAYGGETVQSGEPYDHPRMQARARSPQVLAGGDILQVLADYLCAIGRTTLPNGVEIQDVITVGDPGYIGRDDREWHQYSVNFQVTVKNENRRA